VATVREILNKVYDQAANVLHITPWVGSNPMFWQDSEILNAVYVPAGQYLRMSGGASSVFAGAGSPEGVLAAPVGSLYLRSDGGAATTLYVKETGAAGNTGWTAK
jgi:hypothetical protein